MLCIVIKGPTLSESKAQIEAASKWADLVELRLDFFQDFTIEGLKELKASTSIPMLFTLRPSIQGGQFQGTESERQILIEKLAALNPEFLDLESMLPVSFIREIHRRHPNIKLIISWHGFANTPDNLHHILRAMPQVPDAYYKIASMAHSTLDTMRMLAFTKYGERKLITMSMGNLGQPSRILGPIAGSQMSYASIDDNTSSAPGQLSAETLCQLYNYKALRPSTAIYGIIGYPLDAVMSHHIHNPAFQHFNNNAVFVKMPVKDEELALFFPSAIRLGFKGICVTMPMKEKVFPYLDYIDPEALQIGAVNTIVIENMTLKGYNTDGHGAINAIEEHGPISGKRVIVLGAGGVAKAISYLAHQKGANVVIVNRDADKAEALAKKFGCEGGGLDRLSSEIEKGYDIIIKCTPTSALFDPNWIIPGTLVMDAASLPKNTPFLLAAQEKGCRVVFGYQMFINQALGQWKLWNLIKGDLEPYRKFFEESTLKTVSER